MLPRECTYSMQKWLIYAIWSCEALGSLQTDIASPTNQISLCSLLALMRSFNFPRASHKRKLSAVLLIELITRAVL